jgi:putative DNA primase/helicase
MDTAELRKYVYDQLGRVNCLRPVRKGGEVDHYEPIRWDPNKKKVADVLETMAAVGHISADIDPPSWIDLHSAAETQAAQMVSCINGLLDLSTRTVHDHTPALFNVVSVPFAYQSDADRPAVWLEFLVSVWPDDADSVALLQEHVGYLLSGRTDMQKMLLLIGPTRSGKGTIARMLTELIGRGHVAGPTLASLGTNFGLSPLLGKPLAIISDARLGDTPSHTVVERLLSITGEDMLTVDRKFRDPWSGKLPTRFVILSNELPKFKDSSGAIANRLLILQMTNSFLGREDRTLDARLRAELPGILSWALEGLDRLNLNGRFTVPGSSEDAANLMMDLASPVSAFVRDCCARGPGESVLADRLYDAWKQWAEDNGHHAGAKSTFGRNLRAVVPELKMSQPRVSGGRERRYERIDLRVCNADDPVPPVPDEPGDMRDGSGTGLSRAKATVNAQVNGRGTGGTGGSALWSQHDGFGTGSYRASARSNDNYRAGLCCDCGDRPHSAGRPRCDECHRIWLNVQAGYDQ